jgi:hypothetical protein
MSNHWPYEDGDDPWIAEDEIRATIWEADTAELRNTARRAGRHAIAARRHAQAGRHEEAMLEMAKTDAILPRPE